MGKFTKITCDRCGEDISTQAYQTINVRRYADKAHTKCIRYPAVWLCDRCYTKMGMIMFYAIPERGETE